MIATTRPPWPSFSSFPGFWLSCPSPPPSAKKGRRTNEREKETGARRQDQPPGRHRQGADPGPGREAIGQIQVHGLPRDRQQRHRQGLQAHLLPLQEILPGEERPPMPGGRCPLFEARECERWRSWPYCCNGYPESQYCADRKHYYDCVEANAREKRAAISRESAGLLQSLSQVTGVSSKPSTTTLDNPITGRALPSFPTQAFRTRKQDHIGTSLPLIDHAPGEKVHF